MRSCHQVVVRICWRHDHEVFQSSRMSWSSKIIADGTVESTHRMTWSLHASRYSSAYSTKSLISVPGGSSRLRRCAMNSSASRAASCRRRPGRRAAAGGPATAPPGRPQGSRPGFAGRRPRGHGSPRRRATRSCGRSRTPAGGAGPVEGTDAAGRHPWRGPHGHVVETDGVRVVTARQEAVEDHEGVVRPVHRERGRAPRAPGTLDGDRAASAVATHTVAEVSSTYRSIGPSTSGPSMAVVVMEDILPRRARSRL